MTANSARLSDGEVIPTRTVVWTAGVKPAPVVSRFCLPLDDRGRIVSSSSLQVGLRWSGLPAWLLARTYHLAKMPGLGRRARLLVDWNIGLLFGRDTAELGGLGPSPALGHNVSADGGNGAVPDSAGAEVHEQHR